jgi:hypothetical protein
MYLSAKSGGGHGVVVSPVIGDTKRLPKLVLKCNGVQAPQRLEVVRGTEVTCLASNSTGGAVQVSEWTYQVTDVVPPGSTDGMRVRGPAGRTEWKGKVVVGGTLTVRGTLDAEPAAHEPRTRL